MFDDVPFGSEDVVASALPAGFSELPPGPELAATLAAIDATCLTGSDRVEVLAAWDRLESHCAAQKAAAMVGIHDALVAELGGDSQHVDEAAIAEIGAALHYTDFTAGNRYVEAVALRERVPQVWEALAAGRLDTMRARVLVEETAALAPETARGVVAEILSYAEESTTSQIRRRIRRMVIAADPGAAAKRFDEAVHERRVEVTDNGDGTANLAGYNLPPDRVVAIRRYLTRLARRARRRGDPRGMDQLRADIMLDLLSGELLPDAEGTAAGFVELRVDLATLAGMTDDPGDLGGYGAIVADLARQVAGNTPQLEWRYAITDPDTGQIRHTSTTRRRPDTKLRRFVTARDPTCVYPGCVRPSGDAELDHIQPWSQGGPTSPENLGPLCPKHHPKRHRIGWTYAALGDGTYLWTSRLGHTYRSDGRVA